MGNDIEAQKKVFLAREFFTLAWAGAVQRNGALYNQEQKLSQTQQDKLHEYIRNRVEPFISNIITTRYKLGGVDDQAHFNNILDVRNCLSDCKKKSEHPEYFAEHCLLEKIATAQKLLNLLLKYWWCEGWIAEPPHCPIDFEVYKAAKKLPNSECLPKEFKWTQDLEEDADDNIPSFADSKYGKMIKNFRTIAGDKPLAEWELVLWNNANQP